MEGERELKVLKSVEFSSVVSKIEECRNHLAKVQGELQVAVDDHRLK